MEYISWRSDALAIMAIDQHSSFLLRDMMVQVLAIKVLLEARNDIGTDLSEWH